MRGLATQILLTGTLMFALWLALERGMERFPPMRDHAETSSVHASLLHVSESAQLAGELHRLAKGGRGNMIFVGGSDMQIAFRPEQAEAFFPGYRAHSLSVNAGYGGGDVVDQALILQAAADIMPEASRAESVFVVGISPQTLLAEYVRDVERDLGFDAARKKMFPRLFRVADGKLEYAAGPEAYVAASRFLRPFFAMRRFWEIGTEGGWRAASAWLRRTWTAVPPDAVRDVCSDRPERPDFVIDHIAETVARAPESDAFDRLRDLFAAADRSGVRLVMAALPAPERVRDELPAYLDCVRRIGDAVAAHGSASVRFVDMSRLLGDGCFADAYHLKDEAGPVCARELRRRWPFAEE